MLHLALRRPASTAARQDDFQYNILLLFFPAAGPWL
jgi:hypothetical protein